MTESFDDLNLTDNLLRGIYSYGFENPSPIQGKAIPIMNEKKDLIAQAQSGTGKTGAFSIGVLNNIDLTQDSTQVIIVNPTHELANQNFNVIKELSNFMDCSVQTVIGGTSVKKCQEDLNKNPKVVVGTPGRILDMIEKRYLVTEKLKILVFDEATNNLDKKSEEEILKVLKKIKINKTIILISHDQNVIKICDKVIKFS